MIKNKRKAAIVLKKNNAERKDDEQNANKSDSGKWKLYLYWHDRYCRLRVRGISDGEVVWEENEAERRFHRIE